MSSEVYSISEKIYNRDLLPGVLCQVVSKTEATSPGQVGAEYASLGGLGEAGGEDRSAGAMRPMRWRDDARRTSQAQ